MADVANKYSENVEGKFYVDDQCIDCDLCRETAPANFKRNDDAKAIELRVALRSGTTVSETWSYALPPG